MGAVVTGTCPCCGVLAVHLSPVQAPDGSWQVDAFPQDMLEIADVHRVQDGAEGLTLYDGTRHDGTEPGEWPRQVSYTWREHTSDRCQERAEA